MLYHLSEDNVSPPDTRSNEGTWVEDVQNVLNLLVSGFHLIRGQTEVIGLDRARALATEATNAYIQSRLLPLLNDSQWRQMAIDLPLRAINLINTREPVIARRYIANEIQKDVIENNTLSPQDKVWGTIWRFIIQRMEFYATADSATIPAEVRSLLDVLVENYLREKGIVQSFIPDLTTPQGIGKIAAIGAGIALALVLARAAHRSS